MYQTDSNFSASIMFPQILAKRFTKLLNGLKWTFQAKDDNFPLWTESITCEGYLVGGFGWLEKGELLEFVVLEGG